MLSYDDALVMLGYTHIDEHPLEFLGYEYSTRGREQFGEERPDIEPVLRDAIYHDIQHGGVFPSQYRVRPPQCGVFIEQRGDKYVLIDRDKPPVETRWIYQSLDTAARALIRKCCDHAYLLHPEERDEFLSVEHSWLTA